jgi:hypothetical protein
MGSVSQVFEMGNAHRQRKGLNPLTLNTVFKRQDFWEFVVSRNAKMISKSNSADSAELDPIPITSDYSIILNHKDLAGQIKYSELIKLFPHLIKSKRGKYGGTWAELYILLKIASILDKDLEVEIYEVFINQKILFLRDIGGDSFKEFNKIIDKLEVLEK